MCPLTEYYFRTLFLSIFSALGEQIDTALTNQISISAICVYATLYAVVNPFKAVCMYGNYYYRMYTKHAHACILWAFLTGTVLGIGMVLAEGVICKVYNISSADYPLMHRCLILFAASRGVSYSTSCMSEILVYDGKVRLATWLDTTNWILFLVLDVIAVVRYNSLELVITATLLCNVIYYVKYELITKVYKEKVHIHDFVEIVSGGASLVINRIVSASCYSAIYAAVAQLGGASYALFSVIRGVAEFGQEALNPLQSTCMVKLRDEKLTILEVYKRVFKTYLFACVVGCSLVTLDTVAVHGKVPLSEALQPCLIVGGLAVITYMPFLVGQIFCQLYKEHKVLIHVAIGRCFITAILCLLTRWSPLPCMLYSTATDIPLGIYLYLKLRKVNCKDA